MSQPSPILLTALLAACSAPQTPAAQEPPRSSFAGGLDCHMHVSPAGSKPAVTADHVLTALAAAGLERACILSPGHHRAPECETSPCEQQRGFTERMNDWTIAEARSDRLLAFCGIPLHDAWAPEEVARCAKRGARGLKMHQVTAGVSFTDPEVRARFAAILDAAAKASLPALIHVAMDNEKEVRAFFELVAAQPSAKVIAAHQIAPSLALLPEAPRNLWIEISGLPHAPVEAGAAFVPVWRAFGIERVLLGSDFPQLTPKAHVELLDAYPLTPEERRKIAVDNAEVLFPRQPQRASDE